jgi:hypothetical protein
MPPTAREDIECDYGHTAGYKGPTMQRQDHQLRESTARTTSVQPLPAVLPQSPRRGTEPYDDERLDGNNSIHTGRRGRRW